MSRPLYATREHLSALVRQAQAAGDVSCLVPTLTRIAHGYVAAKFPPDTLDPDDVTQHLCLNVHRHVAKIDPDHDPFNYLTKITNRICQDLTGKHARHRRCLDAAASLLPTPDRRRGRTGGDTG